VQAPPAYRDLAANPQIQAQTASYADLPWWQVFQDQQLQELIRTALKQNYDLQLATERINAARAELAVTRSSLFPQVTGNGNFTGGKDSTSQTKFNFLTLTADAAFQLDLFGRLRRADEAARAQLLATEAARQTVILTLVSDVASDYFARRKAQLAGLDVTLRFRLPGKVIEYTRNLELTGEREVTAHVTAEQLRTPEDLVRRLAPRFEVVFDSSACKFPVDR